MSFPREVIAWRLKLEPATGFWSGADPAGGSAACSCIDESRGCPPVPSARMECQRRGIALVVLRLLLP